MNDRRTRYLLLSLLLIQTACRAANGTAPPAGPPPTRWPTPPPEPVSAARFEPAACPFALPDGYTQGQDVDCGYLVVPEDRTDLPSRAIELAVAIFHPPGGATARDPIVYLSGGPGVSALEFIRYEFEILFEPLMAAGRDVVVFDQRGIGRSRPALDCPEFDDLSIELLDGRVEGAQVDKQQALDLSLEALVACRTRLSRIADLSAYNSAANAADVEDLRRTLRYEELNLWGGSYGSRLALTVMRDHPQGLRSVILDSVYPPEVDLYAESADNFDRALERLFESCTANPVCAQAYPDLRSVFFETVARLNGTPVTTTLTDPLTGDEHPALVTGDVLMGVVFQVLYETELKYLLPQMIYEARDGTFDTLNRIRASLLAGRVRLSRGMMFSVQCHEEVPFSSPGAVEAALARHPDLAGLYEYAVAGPPIFRVCQAWDAGKADPIENRPVTSDVPTLLLGGSFDPVTPPAWGRRVAGPLSRGTFFEFPKAGHGVIVLPDCPRQIMLAFLEQPGRPPDGSCIEEME